MTTPCPTPDCPHTTDDECAMLGCPQRFRKRTAMVRTEHQNNSGTLGKKPVSVAAEPWGDA